ncbi:hypothetical protein [Agromyces sp. NBRC 114283]|uniref:hypothetical protein n=1 Tax=Agromyces sp. NBRC 114283 TaxID=2994521 RepID=UPI0024A55DCF|nr:hypothetical protein [Agromyces sp. NBRC 114283]GLU91292.1 hypothetical protein Agsp01_35470 [Agromyces sp. NBRC 114283]
MWDFDSIYAKAVEYFGRGGKHTKSDDAEFVIWNLLGLEFLLRLPLAKVHASLLAVPDGTSILHANGFIAASNSTPQSIPVSTVITRLQTIVEGFTKAHADDASVLVGLRNAELHTGAPIAENTTNDFWLPKLIRVADVIVEHLGIPLESFLTSAVIAEGRKLIDAQDKKLAHEVEERIRAARAFLTKLNPAEIASRSSSPGPDGYSFVATCPACAWKAWLRADQVRLTAERFEEGQLTRDAVYVVTALQCKVCALTLETTAECVAAGVKQQLVQQLEESLEDRLMLAYEEPDYGND